jgi:hypothetical protein
MIGKLFDHDGDTYRIHSVGVTDERGTFVHGWSINRVRKQRNGDVPYQVTVFIDPATARVDHTDVYVSLF